MILSFSSQQPTATHIVERTQKASAQFSPNEELTRILIDQLLINAGWETDTENLTYKKGARAEKGKNKAIAEWPTIGRQTADYVLFAGLTPSVLSKPSVKTPTWRAKTR